MDPERLQRLLACLVEVRNTDELFDLELRFAPYDEDDPIAARALYELAATRCQLARGPTPSRDGVTLSRPTPKYAREHFEVKGRVDTRIVRIGWADGQLVGSLYALRRLECGGVTYADAARARQRIHAVLDVVLSETTTQRPRRRVRARPAATAQNARTTHAAA
jgi:hypothetical protein